MTTDTSFLQAALIGYEAERQRLLNTIADITKQLGKRRLSKAEAATPTAKRGRRRMSSAARKRIAEAQRKRWAAFRKKKAA